VRDGEREAGREGGRESGRYRETQEAVGTDTYCPAGISLIIIRLSTVQIQDTRRSKADRTWPRPTLHYCRFLIAEGTPVPPQPAGRLGKSRVLETRAGIAGSSGGNGTR